MKVLLDACVLYPTVMRAVLLGCAGQGLFKPYWSPRILEEWARAAARLGPGQEVLARGEIARLGVDFPGALLRHDPAQERAFWLPDPNDIHVLTAAALGGCDAILTMNRKDFPGDILADAGLRRLDPDGFALTLLEQAPDTVQTAATAVLAEANRLSDRPWTIRALMKKARMPRFGKAVERLDP